MYGIDGGTDCIEFCGYLLFYFGSNLLIDCKIEVGICSRLFGCTTHSIILRILVGKGGLKHEML